MPISFLLLACQPLPASKPPETDTPATTVVVSFESTGFGGE